MIRWLLLFVLTVTAVQAAAPPVVELLWPAGAPGAAGQEDADKPRVTVYLPDAPRATGTAVVVLPGGGYGALAMDHEGRQIAQWLNSLGVAAFVLQYRIAPRYKHPAPFQDATRAVRFVRANAERYGLRGNRIGIWGFSAGGHLASTVSTHFDPGDGNASDEIEKASSRPDFAILGYPVITFTEEAAVHKGSRRNLLGETPDPKLVEDLSNERRVTAQTPPTFLFHTGDDPVSADNSLLYYTALRKAKVPAEIHIYEQGPHGVGLGATNAVLASWPARLADWMRVRGVLR
ncbi:MAG: alpha/beta hydrolase [Bryobacteraceae bacterium]|nr:alpha/beta hydrolase [Bryobacteraceae bacterium]